MAIWWDLYEPRRQGLRAAVVSSPSPQGAAQALKGALDHVLSDYEAQAAPSMGRAAATYTGQAQAALGLVAALKAPRPGVKAKDTRTRFWLAQSPALLSLLLGGYLALEGSLVPALMALFSCVAWLWRGTLEARGQGITPETLPPAVEPESFLRTADEVMLAIDRGLQAQMMNMPRALPGKQGITLPLSVLEATQMLSEAQRAGDGDYALKALPGLFAGLLAEQVVLQDYSPDNTEAFDLYPSPHPGRTIRPAVYVAGQLTLRGQATARM